MKKYGTKSFVSFVAFFIICFLFRYNDELTEVKRELKTHKAKLESQTKQIQDYTLRLEEYDKKFEESSRKFQNLLTVRINKHYQFKKVVKNSV